MKILVPVYKLKKIVAAEAPTSSFGVRLSKSKSTAFLGLGILLLQAYKQRVKEAYIPPAGSSEVATYSTKGTVSGLSIPLAYPATSATPC